MDLNGERPYFGPPKFHEKMRAVYKEESQVQKEIFKKQRKIDAAKREAEKDNDSYSGSSTHTLDEEEIDEESEKQFESFAISDDNK
jgi:hypothetical protein